VHARVLCGDNAAASRRYELKSGLKGFFTLTSSWAAVIVLHAVSDKILTVTVVLHGLLLGTQAEAFAIVRTCVYY
jgi:hypothetical protein